MTEISKQEQSHAQKQQRTAKELRLEGVERITEASRRIEHLDSAKDYEARGYEAEGGTHAPATSWAATAPLVSPHCSSPTACLQKHLWFSGARSLVSSLVVGRAGVMLTALVNARASLRSRAEGCGTVAVLAPTLAGCLAGAGRSCCCCVAAAAAPPAATRGLSVLTPPAAATVWLPPAPQPTILCRRPSLQTPAWRPNTWHRRRSAAGPARCSGWRCG